MDLRIAGQRDSHPKAEGRAASTGFQISVPGCRGQPGVRCGTSVICVSRVGTPSTALSTSGNFLRKLDYFHGDISRSSRNVRRTECGLLRAGDCFQHTLAGEDTS
jgi:hypothetical protein